MSSFSVVAYLFFSECWQRVTAAAVTPPTLADFVLLGSGGEGQCWGDDLYRTMSYMSMNVDGAETLEGKATTCAQMCRALATQMDRCMGFEARSSGTTCWLYDRDWTLDEKAAAEAIVSAEAGSTVELFDTGVRIKFGGRHLIRVYDDNFQLNKLNYDVACYRRVMTCTPTLDCAAANRYDCSLGKVVDTCDMCKPGFTGAAGASNVACTASTPTPPTLRVALASGAYMAETHDDYTGYNTGLLGALYALTYTWQNNPGFLPTPLVPVADRRSFNVEFYGFTDNYTKLTSLKEGGSQQISSSSVASGIRAISGTSQGDYATTLELREPPTGTRVHCVLGGRSSESGETAMVSIAPTFQTPVLGWSYSNPTLKGSYYIRSNKVILSAGAALAKLVSTIGYTRITVVQQGSTNLVADQLKNLMTSATIDVINPPETLKGSCSGGTSCREQVFSYVEKLRADDVRVVVHEHGGSGVEFALWSAIDLVGSFVFYAQTGYGCSFTYFYDRLAWLNADYRGVDDELNPRLGLNCSACPNLARYQSSRISDTERENWTYTVEFLYSSDNAYQSSQTDWCPMFPTKQSLQDCTYCHGLDRNFVSPDCETIFANYMNQFSHSFCVEPDMSENIVVKEAYAEQMECVGVASPGCAANPETTSATAVQNLKNLGFPSTWLEYYEPGGRMYKLGNQTSVQKPQNYHAAWADTTLADAMGVTTFTNQASSWQTIVDAFMTVLVAYNEFVRLGGDADIDSSPTAIPESQRQGNSVASGWKEFLLNADFDGFIGRVNYVTKGLEKGERNVAYMIYQKNPVIDLACMVSYTSSNDPAINSVQPQRFFSATWNFKYAPLETISGNIKLPPVGDEEACNPLPANWYATGEVAIVYRGACYFGTKLKTTMDAGAKLTLVVNSASDMPVFMSADDPALQNAGISIGKADGDIIFNALQAGSIISLNMQAPTRCLDTKFNYLHGFSSYSLSMIYDLKADTITAAGGGSVSCTGVPGTPGPSGEPNQGASCTGIVFNDGNRYSSGTIHPPRELAPVCGDGEQYILKDRVCVSCTPGRYRLSSVSAVCLPCLAGRFATGTGNSECTICPSGYKSPAVAPVCTICEAGNFSAAGSEDCSSCLAGEFSSQAGSSQCASCIAGTFSSTSAPNCTLCLPGSVSIMGSSECTACGAGFFAENAGSSECQICKVGSYATGSAGTCTLCAVGTYNPVEGAAGCLECEMGRYAGWMGENVSCTPCTRGSYSAVRGKTQCTMCNGSLITQQVGQQYESNCVCPEGFYRPKDDILGTCLDCPEGMTCKAGSDMNNVYKMMSLNVDPLVYKDLDSFDRDDQYGIIPQLDEGYMSLPERPLWVYQCLGKKVCPGGLPNSCGKHMSEIACGVCADGFHRGETKCIECSSVETSKFLFPILPLILGPSLVFIAYVKMQDPVSLWGSPINGVMVCVFILLNHCQTIAVISVFNLLYPSVVDGTWKHMDFFMKGATILRADCAGVRSFEATFITNMLIPLFVGALFIFTLLVNRVGVCCLGRKDPNDDMKMRYSTSTFSSHAELASSWIWTKVRYHAVRPMNPNILFSCYGALMFSFSISIAAIAFSLFKCYSHPNGKDKSLHSAPEILCYEDKWTGMVGVAATGIIVYCVGSLVFTTVIIIQAPRKFGDLTFRQRWKFLISKFRPEVWWFGNVTIIRGIVINLSIVSFEKGLDQIWWVSIALLGFTCMTIFLQPWRHKFANVIDVLSSCCLVSAVALTSYFAPAPEEDSEKQYHGSGIVIISMLPAIPLLMYGLVALRSTCLKSETQSAKIVLGYKLRTIFQAYIDRGPAELHQFCMRLTEHDVGALKAAYSVMAAEMFKTMATDQPRWYKMRSGTRLIAKQNSQHFDSDHDPLEPWAGNERWRNPGGTQEQALVRLGDLTNQVAKFHKANMPKEEFLELCKKRMNLSPRTSEALFQVIDIQYLGRALTDDISTVGKAFEHPAVRRYCQEFVDVEPAPYVQADSSHSAYEKSYEDVTREDVNQIAPIQEFKWEDIESDMAALNAAPRGHIHSLFEDTDGEGMLRTPRGFTPRASTPRSAIMNASTPREYTFKGMQMTPRQTSQGLQQVQAIPIMGTPRPDSARSPPPESARTPRSRNGA